MNAMFGFTAASQARRVGVHLLPDFTDMLFTCLVCFQVVEFDTPSALLANENSRFYAMFAAAENKVAVKG